MPLEHTGFEMMIGAAVPQQTPLKDGLPEISDVMRGYWGSKYVLVTDKLVIVDPYSGRVAAIVDDAV